MSYEAREVPATTLPNVRFLIDAINASSDHRAQFSIAASSKTVPPRAVSDLIETLDAYAEEPGFTLRTVPAAVARYVRSIEASAVSNEIMTANSAAMAPIIQEIISREGNQGALKAYLNTQAQSLRNTAAHFRSELNEHRAYLAALANKIASQTDRDLPLSRHQCNLLFNSARELVAACANEGRTPSSFALEIESELQACQTAEQAKKTLTRIIKRDPQIFRVALVIDSTARTERIGHEGFRTLYPTRPIQWQEETPKTKDSAANLDLSRFCLKHWGMINSNEKTHGHNVKSQILLREVLAWDQEQARHIALDDAEKIVDRINAEHRTSHFGVKRKVLVRRENSEHALELFSQNAFVPKTRLLNISQTPSVERSLRFATRAASERAGSMQVFFAWIALEYLGRGAEESAQNIIAQRLPSAISLVATRHLCLLAWRESTKDFGAEALPPSVLKIIKRKNSSNPNQFNSDMLTALIVSNRHRSTLIAERTKLPQGEVETAIQDWVQHVNQLPPYARYRVNQVRYILNNPDALRTYMKELRQDADEILQRMRFVRNQTAHQDSAASTEHLMLSEAALKVLDATFEIIPKWGPDTEQSLHKLRVRWKSVYDSVEDWDNSATAITPFRSYRLQQP